VTGRRLGRVCRFDGPWAGEARYAARIAGRKGWWRSRFVDFPGLQVVEARLCRVIEQSVTVLALHLKDLARLGAAPPEPTPLPRLFFEHGPWRRGIAALLLPADLPWGRVHAPSDEALEAIEHRVADRGLVLVDIRVRRGVGAGR
jgi:hypothetical protein